LNTNEAIVPVNITENCLAITQLLRESFISVANEMGFTEENCPNHVAFITQERVIDQLGKDDAYCFGIQENGIWIGFVAVAPYGESYEITRLAVAPEHRHKGYGRALMDTACDKARELGLDSIGLGMLNDNSILKKWYEEQGFIASEPFIPAGASYTACGMSKRL
jgi:ribosomal protein S18 acetylase RimI-like enzyme